MFNVVLLLAYLNIETLFKLQTVFILNLLSKVSVTVISTDFVHGIPSVIVEDDGGGIKPENYDLIFTPFWQEDESRTRNKGGKGIGLSIVKNIALKYFFQ